MMKRSYALCRFVILLAMALLTSTALTQGQTGCGQGIALVAECYEGTKVVEYGDVCCTPGTSGCAPPASDCQACYEGIGQCIPPATGTHTTANWGWDEDCPSCGNEPPTCCNEGIQCSDRELCNGDCECENASPIIVDTTGKGFHLTPANEGVLFDISGGGRPIKIAWTAADSGNAFLALDRNHNGKIDSGKELFGNFTAQPKSGDPNGFLALAEFDKPENGGNGDGIIDKRDAVFAHLLLWIDENHDGISQPNELHTLPELGVFSLALHYRDDRHFFDQYGNWFHYQAAVNPDPRDGKSKDGRVTYDVFFLVADDDRVGTAPAAQSRVSRRQDPRLPLMGSGYEDPLRRSRACLATRKKDGLSSADSAE